MSWRLKSNWKSQKSKLKENTYNSAVRAVPADSIGAMASSDTMATKIGSFIGSSMCTHLIYNLLMNANVLNC